MRISSLLSLSLGLAGWAASSPCAKREQPRSRSLRILPLGDSITYGYESTDGNAYRQKLRESLEGTSGYSVDYVGSQRTGTMADRDHEGHPGWDIEQIASLTPIVGARRPDVVLLMAGTNDVVRDNASFLAEAPARLGALVDDVFARHAAAALVVAQITPFPDGERDALAETFNEGVREVVAARRDAGRKVLCVDMHSALTKDDLSQRTPNNVHPNDGGYAKMAQVWHDGVVEVVEKGWVVPLES